jgi:hypothetical protein
MRSAAGGWKLLLPAVPILWAFAAESQTPRAANPDEPGAAAAPVSCSQFMAPKRNLNGTMVGQDDCLMQDRGIVEAQKKYHRVDIGVSGTLSGWIVKDGARQNYFTSAPDFTFTQFGNPHHPRFHGILKYEAAKGTSLTVVYPETAWNGKLFVLVHGRTGSFLKGSLRSWDKYFSPDRPLDVNKYETAMLAKGYAVARTRRNADGFAPGDYSAILDDGTVWPDLNINVVPELILAEVRLVGNLLNERLGRKPTRTYWYGHSAGAYAGFALNYMTLFDRQMNKDVDGKETISGFIGDDPGGGMFLPILLKDGRDTLYRTPDERSRFIKTLVLSHTAYPLVYSNTVPGEMDLKHLPEGISASALTNKRSMARLFKQKGMDGVFRMYEVRGVSHFGGENLVSGKDGDVQILNLSRLMDGVIDLLDHWVEKGIEPPATKSDDPTVGAAAAAIDLPETACPLGQYYPYPPLRGAGGAGLTSFAPFDGQSLEPLDGRLQFVDMNQNGRRDRRETVTEAWRRLGLLKAGETFDRARYVACVRTTAAKLRQENLITDEVSRLYVEEAGRAELPAR